ncbi:hypothetical protein [Streptomyces syringium]|uniref:hypothetical protein n=1 Tax=Streptomyces syringium TaxID=76729 RepID=UPI00341C7F5D
MLNAIMKKGNAALMAGMTLLFCAMSPSAQAASGAFEYTRADRQGNVTFEDPANACRTLSTGNGAINVSNRTDTVATLYKFDDCRAEGEIATVAARGGTWPSGPTLVVAHAVKFG